MREALVLAGGLGTRLRQAVPDAPKAMALVAGRPFLEILLDQLAGKGFERVVLSLGYMADKITSHFGSTYAGMKVDYVIEASPLGTGGGVRLGLAHCQADHVFVLNGDTYLDLEVDAVEVEWQRHRRPIMVCRRVADTARYGRVHLDETGRRLAGFSEKGVTVAGLINAGCYVLQPNQLDAFAAGSAFSLEADYLVKAAAAAAFDVFITAGHFIDIGIPEDYARAQIELAPRSVQSTRAV
jgi:D-glycero-alpha-D-manno-heptose 1-phosphate guanylyltransferase